MDLIDLILEWLDQGLCLGLHSCLQTSRFFMFVFTIQPQLGFGFTAVVK